VGSEGETEYSPERHRESLKNKTAFSHLGFSLYLCTSVVN